MESVKTEVYHYHFL